MSQPLEIRTVKTAKLTAGLALFAVVRDEDYFLPFFFAHYRSLGVEMFLIYDDRSATPTKAFLHSQPDCAIVESDHAFGDASGAFPDGQPRPLSAALKESVPVWAFPTRWVLTVDADEFLILPTGFDDLEQLTRSLDGLGQPYLTAPMVDFYAETLNHRNYAPHITPFEASPFFDVGPYYEWQGGLAPKPFDVGVRYRLQLMMSQRYPEQFAKIPGGLQGTPALWKVPLLKNGVGVFRWGAHAITVAPAAGLAGALAHFKFYPGLDGKVDVALRERQYYRGSEQYQSLAAAARLLGDQTLICDQTMRFSGPMSLERAGLSNGVAG